MRESRPTYRADQPFAALLERCRELRQGETDAEALPWRLLRARQLSVKFRRQHQFGPYILGFSCPARRLVVEADGSQHGTAEGIAHLQRHVRVMGWLAEVDMELLAGRQLEEQHRRVADALGRRQRQAEQLAVEGVGGSEVAQGNGDVVQPAARGASTPLPSSYDVAHPLR